MKVTSGILGTRLETGLLRHTVLVSLALGIALTLLLIPGSAAADGPYDFLVPIVLEEGRTPPKVVDPPGVRDLRQVTETPTSEVLVGNNDEADSSGQLQFNRDRGQAFTTGSNSAGYKLTSVEIAANVTLASVGNWAVSITSAGTSAGPGSTLSGGHLSEPAGLTTGISNSFTASVSGIDLAPNTTYYVLIDLSAENSTAYWKATGSNNENANPAAGWSIGNASYLRAVGSNGSWTELGSHKLKIRVNGYAKTAPAPTGATVNGTALVITFDKALDTTSGTAPGQFTILAGGTSHAATGLSISGNQVMLTGPAVTANQIVWVSYTNPTSNPLKGTNGGIVDAFSNQDVTNNTAPTLTSAAINGSTLDLYFSSPLDANSGTAPSRFTIEVGGSSHAATGITIYTTQIRLTVPGVKGGQFVTVSYSKPGSSPLKGSNGTSVDTFSNKAVTNNTPAPQGGGRVRDPIIVRYTNAQGEEETVENRAASADRDTLWQYFYDSCKLQRSSTTLRDYSWRNADGHLMQARNGWKYVEVQDDEGNVVRTRAQTLNECANHGMYLRQQNCANEDWLSWNPHLHDGTCPANRTW